VLSYLLGRLSLERALNTVSDRTGIRVRPVVLSHARACIDVDTVADLRLVESILSDPGRFPAEIRKQPG